MSGEPGPIEAYLAALARELGRFSRGRRRLLDEAEDHLQEAAAHHRESGASPHEAELQAVSGLGPPRIVAAADPHHGPWLAALAGGALTAFAAATAMVVSSAQPHSTPLMSASNAPVPASIRNDVGAARPIPPGARIDATVRLSTGATYALLTYRWHRRRCEAEYLTGRGPAAARALAASSWCLPPGAALPAVDLALDTGSGADLIVSGTAPLTADRLGVTTASGRTQAFALPHIRLHSDHARQAVIVDLSAAHIQTVARLALRTAGHTTAARTL